MIGGVLPEPVLEFGGAGKHIDPRHGLTHYGPLDATSDTAPERIRVGIVGAAIAVEGIRTWLYQAREPIAGKAVNHDRQRALFPDFPGFNPDQSFRSVLVFEESSQRPISQRVLRAAAQQTPAACVATLVDAYIEEITWLAERDSCDVIVCARPEMEQLAPQPVGKTSPAHPDFHDQLKAAALGIGPPLQVMRPETWGETNPPPKGFKRGSVQDPATRAWNLHTALYYKAGGAPWRLVRSYADTTTCYLGISFYNSIDSKHLHTSVAQLFNERGEGVVVRGGPAAIMKDNRQPHLSSSDARDLVVASLRAYRAEHKNFPARLVIHKSSRFLPEEREGIDAAADEFHIEEVDLIWVSVNDPARLFRHGEHPPLRGTFAKLASERLLVYTRGSVDFYGTHPGMRIPKPLMLRPTGTHHQPEKVAAETLALTKLNWNHSQLDAHLPITLHASDKVKALLRRREPGSIIARRYAYYM